MNQTTNEVTDVTPIQPQRRQVAVAATDLIRLAIEQNADIDKLERLIALQAQMQAAAAAQAHNEAFAAFKAEAVKIIKNRSVTAGPLNGKKYAELFAVVNATTPYLSLHGLSTSWRITKDEKDWVEVTCYLRHVGGHVESVSMGGPPDAGGAKNAIQARASTITYLERYTLKAILGLSEQEDDDDGGAGGDADPLAEHYASLLEELQTKATDEDALALYKAKAPTLSSNVKLQGMFKAAVVAHRTKLKEGAPA